MAMTSLVTVLLRRFSATPEIGMLRPFFKTMVLDILFKVLYTILQIACEDSKFLLNFVVFTEEI